MKTKIKGQYRQGDVLLTPSSLPKSAKKQIFKGRIILAHGEVTGHHHSIDAEAADWWKDGATNYVVATKKTTLEHQEHGLIQISPKEVKRHMPQREYAPKSIRNVAD